MYIFPPNGNKSLERIFAIFSLNRGEDVRTYYSYI
jgi:hypothetical protein